MSSQFVVSAPVLGAPQMLGYLFQVRVALLGSQRLKSAGTFTVTIETLDDVAFQVVGSPLEVLQTKHHINREGNLGDASPDLWKSFRVFL